MADLNPKNMLQFYRLNADATQNSQAAAIRDMDPKDALELLAYMTMNNTVAVQHVHRLVDPVSADTQAMPDTPSRN